MSFEDDIADVIVDDDAPTADDIRRALGHLAFNQRAALVMRELEGRSYAEIAEILDLSTSAVETLIFRARRALREQLEGAFTCGEAEFAISRQLDGRLPRQERGQLRAHLRECSECATFARRQRAQRGALKSLALVPVPSSLTSFFGGGGAAVGTGVAIKAAAAVTAGLAIGGVGYEGVRHAPWRSDEPKVASVERPVAQSFDSAAVAPPALDRMPESRPALAAEPKRHGAKGHKAGLTAAKKEKKANPGKALARGRGHQKLRYAGDASVAARHFKTGRQSVRTSPAPPPRSRGKAKRKSSSHLPGPFDTKPPKPQKP